MYCFDHRFPFKVNAHVQAYIETSVAVTVSSTSTNAVGLVGSFCVCMSAKHSVYSATTDGLTTVLPDQS